MTITLIILTGDRTGEKLTLDEKKTYILGRDNTTDIPLPEKKISRRHASLTIQNGVLKVEDLRSLNGTFVNGSLINEQTTLNDRDRFQIGSYLFEVSLSVGKQKKSEPSIPSFDDDSLLRHTDPSIGMEIEHDFVETNTSGASISGRLSEVSLADLLQMLASTKKSGRLVIAANKKDLLPMPPAGTPSLYIKEGDLIGAELHDLKNEAAFFQILRWQNGFFSLFPQVQFEWKDPIQMPLEALLLEGYRLLDEEKTASVEFTPETLFEVRLDEPLSQLEPDELRIFQLTWKKKKMSLILDSSHLDQKSTNATLRKLLRSGYVKKL
ncbi:MAG: hypothetical protein JWQ35_2076 [Bacteriovoracaceae bacterium]|nr:hypothetical protein [Bacteriovoracaceae bacterium]